MTPENVGGIPLGDLSESPQAVWCPITRENCHYCTTVCRSGNLRTPAPKPAEELPYSLDYTAILRVRNMLEEAGDRLHEHPPPADGVYTAGLRVGACAERLWVAARAVTAAMNGLHFFLDDEGAAVVLAPREET
jgi:hypothetical protein